MFTIDRLVLRLPGGFEKRARNIADLVARELSALQPTVDWAMDIMHVPLSIADDPGDRDLARSIAHAVASAAGIPAGGRR